MRPVDSDKEALQKLIEISNANERILLALEKILIVLKDEKKEANHD